MDSPQQKKKVLRLCEKGTVTLKFCLDHAFSLLTSGSRELYFQTSWVFWEIWGICLFVFLKHLKHVCAQSKTTMHPFPFNVTLTTLFRPVTENNKYASESHLLNTEILQPTHSALGLCFQIYAVFQPAFIWIPLYYLKFYYFSHLPFMYLKLT